MSQVDLTALPQHHVEIELPAQPFIEPEGVIEKARADRIEVVRPGGLGIAARVAWADMTSLEQRHPAHPMLPGEKVRRRQSMPPAANDHHVVRTLRRWCTPRRLPARVTAR